MATGFSTARVDGQINPEGQTTTYEVQWDRNGTTWCQSGGTSGSPTNTTAPTVLPFSDSTAHDVPVDLSGLKAGNQNHYCARFVATNGDGESDGGQVKWAQELPPDVHTSDAFATGVSTATVEGDVNPLGLFTSYWAEYAPADSDWCTSGGTTGPPQNSSSTGLSFTDDTSHNVSVDLGGLTAGDTYCVRIVATNQAGKGQGSLLTWAQSFPDAVTFDSYSTGASTATVEGAVNPAGVTTTYQVQYDLASSTWCTSGGTSGSPANTTSPTSDGLDPTDSDYQFASADLTGLTEGSGYCAQLVATNGTGEADGGPVTWTQGLPTAETFDGFATDYSTATVEGDVNPAGQVTTYRVDYDLADSEWCESGGSSGSPANTTGPTDLGFTDATFHDLSIDLTGLSPGDAYCAEIVASNTGGTSEGGLVVWTQPTPPPPPPPPPPQTVLTVHVEGVGTVTSSPAGINCTSTCSETFAPGTKVTLTATGTFLGWLVPGCPTTAGSPPPSTCTITLNFSRSVIAHFAAPPPRLAVQLAGTGSGTVTSTPAGMSCSGSACSGSFAAGTRVTLNAMPSAGSSFAGWSGGNCPRFGACVVTAGTSETLTATFTKNPPPRARCTLKSSGSTVKLKGKSAGSLTLKVTCNQAVYFELHGRVTIKTKSGRKTKTSHVSLKVAHGHAKAGATHKVTLKVPKAALTKLKQHAAESIAFSVTAGNANGTSKATASIKHLRAG